MSASAAAFRRPSNWKEQAPEPLPGTLTFASQSSLPKLPVPKLEDTLGRFKESLKPIAWTEEEFKAAAQKIDEFGAGKGKELHERLLKHDQGTKHWLENWWDDGGYLGYRDSVRLSDDMPRELAVKRRPGRCQCLLLLCVHRHP